MSKVIKEIYRLEFNRKEYKQMYLLAREIDALTMSGKDMETNYTYDLNIFDHRIAPKFDNYEGAVFYLKDYNLITEDIALLQDLGVNVKLLVKKYEDVVVVAEDENQVAVEATDETPNRQ